MNPFHYIGGKLPPKLKTVGGSIVAGAVIGGATGGLAEMVREFNMPTTPPIQPRPNGYADGFRHQRHHNHQSNRGRN